MIDVDDMHTRVLDKLLAEINAYWDDDLFTREALHGHIDSWFRLAAWTVNDFLDEVDFCVEEIREHFFDF